MYCFETYIALQILLRPFARSIVLPHTPTPLLVTLDLEPIVHFSIVDLNVVVGHTNLGKLTVTRFKPYLWVGVKYSE